MIVHTEFGHDPDDAIALAYLIEHDVIPETIILTPGSWIQECALSGFLESYMATSMFFGLPKLERTTDGKAKEVNVGKHKVFLSHYKHMFFPLSQHHADKILILGPPKRLGHMIYCDEMFFQGGYSPNSIKPLEKFKEQTAVPSFNPNGAKKDFNLLLETPRIKTRYYIGKNVCHGFTKDDLEKIWVPENKVVRTFWDHLNPTKAMHDVLAAILMVDKDKGIWEQAKPVWHGNKLSTEPTDKPIFSLIGLKSC